MHSKIQQENKDTERDRSKAFFSRDGSPEFSVVMKRNATIFSIVFLCLFRVSESVLFQY